MVGLVTVAFLIVASLAAPLLAPQNPDAQDLAGRLAPPSAAHWFGTDELGRDSIPRILYGGRVTLGMVVSVVLLVAPIGLAVGSVAGYLGGMADRVLMRVTDVFLAFPRLVLALAFVAALKPGITSAIIAIALTAWPPYARLARADTLTVRGADFIAAVRLTGAAAGASSCATSCRCVCQRHRAGDARHERHYPDRGGLGFLGMGAQPPMPEWGTMIAPRGRSSWISGGCRRSPDWRSSLRRWLSTCWGMGCGMCWIRSSDRCQSCVLRGKFY